MTFNKGSISLVSRSTPLRLPVSIWEVPRLLPPVLRLIFNLNQLLKKTVNEMKAANSSVMLEQVELPFFPSCFVPTSATLITKKRKSN